MPIAHVINKIDLAQPAATGSEAANVLPVSALTGVGIASLRAWLLRVAGWRPHGEGLFMARERHLDALREASAHLRSAGRVQAFELMAEELRLAQSALARITGEFGADDLLGAIFSRFCIGK
jgi:tRNA modification GTPase